MLQGHLFPKEPVEDSMMSLSDNTKDDSVPRAYKWDCNQIRAKINALIRSGEMKVTQFQRLNRINSNSYARFMRLKGPYCGIDNQTYDAAHTFFLSREQKGIKVPKANQAAPDDVAKYDVSDIEIPGELEGDVTIFDTCDDVRGKIQAHLRRPGITQASFLREIGKMYGQARSIQGKQLSDFLRKAGATAGNTSSVYYASYVYFEKLRLKSGTRKSHKRQEVEIQHPNGMPTDRRRERSWVPNGAFPYEDEFGIVSSWPLVQ